MDIKKYLQLKANIFIFLIAFLCLNSSCENEDQLYKGTIVSINRGGCFNIVEITKAPTKGELPVSTTIAFDIDTVSFNHDQTISFRLITFDKWEGNILAFCLTPQFYGKIELIK